MKKIKIHRKVPLIERPVFIDAISRSGKFFFCKVVSGLENVEYFQAVSALDHVPYLEKLGVISEDAAIALLQTYVDEYAYYMRIGRNLNFRHDDGSCVGNSLEPDRYLKRSLGDISENIIEEIKQDGRMSAFALHESLANVEIFFKTFPDLRWINLIRHPVDVIHSWYVKEYGHRYGTDPLMFVPVVKGQGGPVPWFAREWEKEYRIMPDIDRIIKTVSTVVAKGETSYQSLARGQKKQICTVMYENIVSRAHDELKKIAAFLEVPISKRMPAILAREKCPRDIDPQQRKKKIEEIKAMASKKMFEVMMAMAAAYEKKP